MVEWMVIKQGGTDLSGDGTPRLLAAEHEAGEHEVLRIRLAV